MSDLTAQPPVVQSENSVRTSGPLTDLTWLAFDVETTGLSPIACRLVELSGVKFQLGEKSKQSPDETFSRLINPGEPIPPEVSLIHGIDDAMVANEPSADVVLAEFIDFAGTALMIAHNAGFDVEFIKVQALKSKLPVLGNLVVDTLHLAQVVLSDVPNYKLKTLSEYFGFAGSQYHRALDDSIYVQKLFCELLKRSGIETLEALIETGSVQPFDGFGRSGGPLRGVEHLPLLNSAIEGRQTVQMTYQSEFRSKRVVRPQSVIESRGALYLTAYCLKSQAERTFRVDRIVEASLKS